MENESIPLNIAYSKARGIVMKSAVMLEKSSKDKFQADLAPIDAEALNTLMAQLQVRSKADFLAKAIYFLRWAVNERRRGGKIAAIDPKGQIKELVTPELERIAPQVELPVMSRTWSEEELKNFMEMAERPAAEPTADLVRIMKHKRQ